ncbi:MAG: hypothetical protein HYY44_07440 [Deltaproteobacteria bacterium]|nr:hypothetical protein [Deltaproteobacteria bacterium]MBI4374784.1 hypothetical protein [Deltaproteobacteria bacterium]
MPARIFYDILVVDRSALARNMYQVLFSTNDRYRLRFSEEYQSLFKKSARFRPDLLLVNSNAIKKEAELKFPCPTVLLTSKNRTDIKDAVSELDHLYLIEKPFYPYDLLSVAHKMVRDRIEKPRRGRPPGKGKKRKS